MMKHFHSVLSVLFTLFFFMSFPIPASADPLITQVGGNPVIVPEGQMVESVLSMGTDARIAGTVKDVVLVLNGDVYLEANAQVDLVIDLGGSVKNTSLVPAKTGIFELNFTQSIVNQLLLGSVLVLGLWFVRLLMSILGILGLTGIGYLLRKQLVQSKELLASSTGRLLGMGTVVLIIFIALAILLFMTIIGIPLGILLLMIMIVAIILGIIPVVDYFSEKVLANNILELPLLSRLLAESFIFVALVNLPMFGIIIFFVASMTGLGLVVSRGWLFYKRRKK